jgi:uncharacterized membrane protein YfcA
VTATAILLGLVIGAALGLLGGGGSILTVPIFVYVLGFDPKDAIAMSLAVVGMTSLVGVAGHWRAGNVNVRVAALFGGVAMAGTWVGAHLASVISGGTQLIIFGLVMLAAATVMLRGASRAGPGDDMRTVHHGALPVLAGGGLLVGVLTGVVGVGGGFLIVPALVLVTLSMRKAVGTSLLIIAANCAVGLWSYLGHVDLVWPAVALVTAGTIPGISLGTWAHRLVPQPVLRQAFAALLVAMGVFIVYQNAGPVLSAFSRAR